MEITDDTIKHLSQLARLHFSEEEIEKMKEDFARMLEFVDKLKELDVKDIDPLIYMNEENTLFWREDVAGGEVSKEEALKNAPDKDSDYFIVPKVLEK
jgi:aspartyl-tRNA(Asn)/glutamyl-tRNA(Gln) amidotransferase subunit C